MFQFRRFPTYCYFIHSTLTRYCRAGFPHSDIHGSRDICSSPWLFAACRVLHRLLMPRHSPCALISLTFVGINCASFASAVRLRLLAKAHTAPFVPPLKSETRFRFVGQMAAAQFNPRYGLIAVLRIMQALQKICVCCVLPLKFHIYLLLPHSYRAWRPLLPCFFFVFLCSVFKVQKRESLDRCSVC